MRTKDSEVERLLEDARRWIEDECKAGIGYKNSVAKANVIIRDLSQALERLIKPTNGESE